MFERFTREARATVQRAVQEAQDLGSPTVEAEHLLLALAGSPAMRRAEVDRDDVLAALDREEERALAAVGVTRDAFHAPPRAPAAKRPPFGASSKLVLQRALKTAMRRGDKRILPEHVLLGVLAAEVGTVPRALSAGDIDADGLRAAAEAELERRHSR